MSHNYTLLLICFTRRQLLTQIRDPVRYPVSHACIFITKKKNTRFLRVLYFTLAACTAGRLHRKTLVHLWWEPHAGFLSFPRASSVIQSRVSLALVWEIEGKAACFCPSYLFVSWSEYVRVPGPGPAVYREWEATCHTVIRTCCYLSFRTMWRYGTFKVFCLFRRVQLYPKGS